MAVLSDADRFAVWADLMRSALGPCAATKPQLRACVDAADGWVDANLAAFQAAIPESLRATGPSQVLLANVATIAAGAGVDDVEVVGPVGVGGRGHGRLSGGRGSHTTEFRQCER